MTTNQLQRYKAIGVVAIVAVVAFAIWKLRGSSSGEAGGSADAGGMVIPAQEAAEEGLRLRARVEPRQGGRTVRLEIGSGAATLELDDAEESATDDSVPMAFGRGTLVAPDRERGHHFVEALARFVETPAPPRRANPTPLEPLEISYVRLASAQGDKPETLKLFFQHRNNDAELYLNLFADGKTATLLEKDEDYRASLLSFFAIALRDGTPPPRTTKSDPNLASDEPLIDKPIAMKGDCNHFAFTSTSLYCARGATLLEWSNPKQPPKTVATLPAEINDLIAAPDGKRVAVFQVRRADEKVATSEDPIWLVLWDRAASAHHELVAAADSPFAAQWSPDGQSLAVALHTKLDAKTSSIVRVYDAQTRRAIASTDPGLDVNLHGWRGRELLLVHSEYLKEPPVHDLYTWTPGTDPPKRASTPPPILSPDGRYAVSVDGDTLRVRDTTSPDAERTFRATQPDDKLALENLEVPPTFLGPHGLLFAAEETFVLNLETLKLQRAFARDDLIDTAVSPDGRRMVLENGDEELFFAELE